MRGWQQQMTPTPTPMMGDHILKKLILIYRNFHAKCTHTNDGRDDDDDDTIEISHRNFDLVYATATSHMVCGEWCCVPQRRSVSDNVNNIAVHQWSECSNCMFSQITCRHLFRCFYIVCRSLMFRLAPIHPVRNHSYSYSAAARVRSFSESNERETRSRHRQRDKKQEQSQMQKCDGNLVWFSAQLKNDYCLLRLCDCAEALFVIMSTDVDIAMNFRFYFYPICDKNKMRLICACVHGWHNVYTNGPIQRTW